MDDELRQPTDEELEAQLREEIKRLRVADVAGEVIVTLVTLGYQKLGLTRETLELRHLPDARLAIELLRAMIETLEREQAGDVQAFRSTLAAMQLQYARVAALPEGELPGGEREEASAVGEQEGAAAAGEQEEPPAGGEKEGPSAGGEQEGAAAAGGGERAPTGGDAGPQRSDDASRAAEKLWVPPGARGKKKST